MRRFEANDERLQREGLGLGRDETKRRFVQAERSGHYVQIIELEAVVREIRRMFEQVWEVEEGS